MPPVDPSLDYRHWRKDFASVFPAIHSSFYAYSNRAAVLQTIKDHGFKSFDQFNYLGDEGLFRYDAALYSAGVTDINVERSRVKDWPIWKRRADTTVISDSGGFQVYKGIWEPGEYHEKRAEILAWQEAISDIAIAMDVPSGCVGSDAASSIETFDECLYWSKLNFEWQVKNRDPRKARMLNVMQGISEDGPDGALRWYDEVKGYCDRSKWGDNAFDGWAFGGMAVRTSSTILRTIARMLQDGFLGKETNQRWIHMLGVTGIQDVVFFTLLQRALRKILGDEGFTVSCDAASAHSNVGRRGTYYAEAADGFDNNRPVLNGNFFRFDSDDTPDFTQFVKDWAKDHPETLVFDAAWVQANMELFGYDIDFSKGDITELEIGIDVFEDNPGFLLAVHDYLVAIPEYKAFAAAQIESKPGFMTDLWGLVTKSLQNWGSCALAEHLTLENYWNLVEEKPKKKGQNAQPDYGWDDDGDDDASGSRGRLTPMGYIVHTFISQEMYLRYTYEGAAAEIGQWASTADELAEALVSETPDTDLAKIRLPKR